MISGVINSLWRIPRENDGAVFLFPYTFSGLCAPGPGFCVASVEKKEVSVNQVVEKTLTYYTLCLVFSWMFIL